MQVRTRFAPSPTGYVHVGSVRTALYNYLFACHHGGKYILRIEDTDQSREVQGAVENLLKVMSELGIEHDEGPDCGGSVGPYTQSERKSVYRKWAKVLVDSDHAYHCYCSHERLTKMRDEQIKKGESPRYDGHCREWHDISTPASAPNVLRLKVPINRVIKVQDLVRGTVEFDCDTIDDQVLVKSDGMPTYHFANVVDDHCMEITHVIRGEEWLISTPKHLLIYEFLGWNPPQFAHLPLLLNPDRSKLSKRQGDVSVEDFLQAGYLREALCNFLVLLGWNSGDDREVFSLQDLIKEFSLERVSKSGAVFDREKLDWMNATYLRSVISETEYFEIARKAIDPDLVHQFEEKALNNILIILRSQLKKPQDINGFLKICQLDPQNFDFSSQETQEIMKLDSNSRLFDELIDSLAEVQCLTSAEFKSLIREIQKRTKIKGKSLYMPLRLALTGQLHGPELFVFSEILGVEEMTRRFSAAKEFCSP
jgi:nondiscriminating glutamyl-tRNA synthetase